MDQQYQILKCIKNNQLETTTMKTNTSLHQQSLISEPVKTSPTEMIWKIIRLRVRNMIMDQQYQILRCIKSDQLEAATTKINTSLHQQFRISQPMKTSLIEMIWKMIQLHVRNTATDQQYQTLRCIKSDQLEAATTKINTSLHQQSLISLSLKPSLIEMIRRMVQPYVRNMITDQQYQILECIKSNPLETATMKINTSLHQQSLISLSVKPSLIEMIRRMVQPYVRNMITDQQYQILECI